MDTSIENISTQKISAVLKPSFGKERKIAPVLSSLNPITVPGQQTRLLQDAITAKSPVVGSLLPEQGNPNTYNTVPVEQSALRSQHVEQSQYEQKVRYQMKGISKPLLEQIKAEIKKNSQNEQQAQLKIGIFESMREQAQTIHETHKGEELLIIFLTSQMLKRHDLQSFFPNLTSQALGEREAGILGSFLNLAGILDLYLVIGQNPRVWLEWKFNGYTYRIDPANYPVDITQFKMSDEEAYQQFMEMKGFPVTDSADVPTQKTSAIKLNAV